MRYFSLSFFCVPLSVSFAFFFPFPYPFADVAAAFAGGGAAGVPFADDDLDGGAPFAFFPPLPSPSAAAPAGCLLALQCMCSAVSLRYKSMWKLFRFKYNEIWGAKCE